MSCFLIVIVINITAIIKETSLLNENTTDNKITDILTVNDVQLSFSYPELAKVS